ncbi:transcription factor 21 [Echeneis naucrates]|uniref:BHLH domain-containing protein n=1 Tax=Echeneis naucrates TaxID=173247 RepID=A0A665VQ21_ECHNA|nr:musculin [Echeneis naucrates]
MIDSCLGRFCNILTSHQAANLTLQSVVCTKVLSPGHRCLPAMSTGSAASDAEDYDTCCRRTGSPLKRSKISCFHPGPYSDEELEDEGVDGRIKQQRRPPRAHGKEARQSQRNAANARERARMRVLSKAFSRLKTSLPWVPADTKLSKLDTLRLASSYISHLRQLLQDDRFENSFAHPVSLSWPFMMTGRSEDQDIPTTVRLCGATA